MTAAPQGPTDDGSWTVILAASSVVLNAFMAFGAGLWALMRGHRATDEKIATRGEKVAAEMVQLERKFQDDIDLATRNIGEAIRALRDSHTRAELWNRDNFVSKQTFNTVAGELKRGLERFEDRVLAEFGNINKKLDKNSAG